MEEMKRHRLSDEKSAARKKKRVLPRKPTLANKKNKFTSYLDKNVMRSEISHHGEEALLAEFIFGGEGDLLEEPNSEIISDDEVKEEKNDSFSEVHFEEEMQCLNAKGHSAEKRKPAWIDEDDENILVKEKAATLINCHKSMSHKGGKKYAEYLKEKYAKIMGTPKWAEFNREKKSESVDSAEESDDELLQKTRNFIAKSTTLPKGIIDIRKCQNFSEGKETGIIKSIEFHPTSKVALVAGLNGIVTLYQVDGKINSKIQSVVFENFPIHTAHFSADGTDIIVGSKEYGHFFYYDMIAGKVIKVPWEKRMDQMNVRRFHVSPDGKIIVIHGKYGNIHLLSARTKVWIDTVKMNGEVYAINFNKDGSRMYSHGDNGKVYVWDMSSRRCIHRFNDQGCLAGTAIAVSPNGEYLASGSDCGVVNVYESASVLSSITPSPIKAIMNLTTEVTSLKFNNTSEILAMASSHKKDALKLVHFPSVTVFSNFPNANQKVLHPNCLDISLNSGYLSFGNNVGNAYLYRLRHFANY